MSESCISIKDEDIEKLSLLNQSTNLVHLSLNDNAIETRGYGLLLSYLENIPSFQHISITNNAISTESNLHINQMIEEYSSPHVIIVELL